METSEIVKNTNLLLTVKYKKAAKFKANSQLIEKPLSTEQKRKMLIHAEIAESEDGESEAIDIFISIKNQPD
jgi:hypothetical protein